MAVRTVTVTMALSDRERKALERLHVAPETGDGGEHPVRITGIRDVILAESGPVVQVTIADPQGSDAASEVLEQRLRQRLAEITPGVAEAD